MKVVFGILMLLMTISMTVVAQEKVDTTAYIMVDRYPVLITNDGKFHIEKLKEFINKNLEFPDNGNDCIGAVYISFIVEKNGEISNKRYVRKLCPGFNENAMKVIDLMNTWEPGIKEGKVVRTQITVPIKWYW